MSSTDHEDDSRRRVSDVANIARMGAWGKLFIAQLLIEERLAFVSQLILYFYHHKRLQSQKERKSKSRSRMGRERGDNR